MEKSRVFAEFISYVLWFLTQVNGGSGIFIFRCFPSVFFCGGSWEFLLPHTDNYDWNQHPCCFSLWMAHYNLHLSRLLLFGYFCSRVYIVGNQGRAPSSCVLHSLRAVCCSLRVDGNPFARECWFRNCISPIFDHFCLLLLMSCSSFFITVPVLLFIHVFWFKGVP